MLFTDAFFLFYFLPIALLVAWWVSPQPGNRFGARACAALFVTTLVFYGSKEPWWLAPFLFSVCMDYLWARLLSRTENVRVRKLYCTLSVVQNLSVLGVFKYWNFLSRSLAGWCPEIFGSFPIVQFDGSDALLPAGISFYTFESMSFVIDVYRREVHPPRYVWQFLGFIAMFPRFIAGPIIRYKNVVDQFERYEGMRFGEGFTLFVRGLFLKSIFADSFAVFVTYAFVPEGHPDFLGAWVGVFAYTMQIYFDFAGYSWMAIGLGRCLGFDFGINFDRPYHATSFQDFWRRWHISLSTWLRDYLYKPLGGNRTGARRLYLNLFLTMVLGGLWHGANWTFVLWGAWHGALLCVERRFGLLHSSRLARPSVFLGVMLGWVLFRAASIGEAWGVFREMFSVESFGMNLEGFRTHPLSLGFCVVGAIYAFWGERDAHAIRLSALDISWVRAIVTVALFVATLSIAYSSLVIPFLYFQF